MKNKKTISIILLLIGIVLIIAMFLIEHAWSDQYKSLSGILLGIGSGLIGLSIAQLYTQIYFKKHKDQAELQNIEDNDERTIMIRDKSEAKAGKITNYAVIALAFICILNDESLWIILFLIGIYVANFIIGLIFLGQLNKEL